MTCIKLVRIGAAHYDYHSVAGAWIPGFLSSRPGARAHAGPSPASRVPVCMPPPLQPWSCRCACRPLSSLPGARAHAAPLSSSGPARDHPAPSAASRVPVRTPPPLQPPGCQGARRPPLQLWSCRCARRPLSSSGPARAHAAPSPASRVPVRTPPPLQPWSCPCAPRPLSSCGCAGAHAAPSPASRLPVRTSPPLRPRSCPCARRPLSSCHLLSLKVSALRKTSPTHRETRRRESGEERLGVMVGTPPASLPLLGANSDRPARAAQGPGPRPAHRSGSHMSVLHQGNLKQRRGALPKLGQLRGSPPCISDPCCLLPSHCRLAPGFRMSPATLNRAGVPRTEFPPCILSRDVNFFLLVWGCQSGMSPQMLAGERA